MIYIVFIVLFSFAAVADITWMRIPNLLSVLLVFLFMLAAGLAPERIDWLGHGLTAAVVFGIGALCFYLGYWGGGDVKLYAAGALWMGPDLILPFVFWVSLLAGLVALVLLGLRRIVRLSLFAGSSDTAETLPLVLMPQSGVPLGLPLAVAAILFSARVSPALWVF